MTTATDTTSPALADYFTLNMDPLLGAWDADLEPEEYGDQSGWAKHVSNWEDDHASFSSNDDDDDHSLASSSCDDNAIDGEWNIVYAASFTVVASTSATTTTASNEHDDNINSSQDTLPTTACSDDEEDSDHSCTAPPPMPAPSTITRKDSKVRFCEQPPTVNCYETCPREQYPDLYYSVHELQKIIDDLRKETLNGNNNNSPNTSKGTKTPVKSTRAAVPIRST